MRQKKILMMLLLSGALSSCGREAVDRSQFEEHVYENQTVHSLAMTAYSKDALLDGYVWVIDAGKSISIKNELTAGQWTCAPFQCDSVLVTFDDQKKITVQKGKYFLSKGEFVQVSDNYYKYNHYISDELYYLAL